MRFDRMVTLSDKESNQVDKLLEQVSQIRKKCMHEFKMEKSVDLQESKVHGVYIVGARGETYKTTIVCVKCSEKWVVSLAKVCPACLGDIKPDNHVSLRGAFFPDGEYLYYGAFPGHCTKCDLKVVWDEWNQ
ncbi:MAG: hypothetical protein HYT64_00220 [Candidatus Yanofskybacteria bacterium]|nr:hypothetical protein [Candidatus Yanofskybacteria bacterium]